MFEELRTELGYADYLGALQRYRAGDRASRTSWRSRCSCRLSVREPALSRRARCHRRLRAGDRRILSDGDVVFQPRKIERSACGRRSREVLIYIHKEQMLDDVEAAIRPSTTSWSTTSCGSWTAMKHDLGRSSDDGVSATGSLCDRSPGA